MKLCECGCGQAAPLAKHTQRSRGYVEGQPVRFIPGHNQKRRDVAKSPYAQLNAVKGYEHLVIVERVLGKPLPAGANVHHVDGDGRNNAHKNLVVCQDMAYHKLLHVRQAVIASGGNPNTQRVCSTCRELKLIEEFNRRTSNKSTGLQTSCRACQREYQKAYQRPDPPHDPLKDRRTRR